MLRFSCRIWVFWTSDSSWKNVYIAGWNHLETPKFGQQVTKLSFVNKMFVNLISGLMFLNIFQTILTTYDRFFPLIFTIFNERRGGRGCGGTNKQVKHHKNSLHSLHYSLFKTYLRKTFKKNIKHIKHVLNI